MDETIGFWRDLLGLPLVGGIGERGSRQYFFDAGGGSLISFFEWKGVQPVEDKDPGRPVSGPFVFDHICLEVEDADALWRLKEHLEEAGVWVTEVLDNGFIHSFFTTDPNNIQVEVCISVEGRDLRKHPRMADPEPTPRALEGPQGKSKIVDKTSDTSQMKKRLYPGPLLGIFLKKNRWEE
ncbi:MAG: VOC family protein [Nitrospirae bacterium]|nr:MAG: VOC family protein [Nitrospirota bacterium]